MKIRYYLELDIGDDEKIINNLATISEAERTTLQETLRNVLENFFNQGGHTPCFHSSENVPTPNMVTM